MSMNEQQKSTFVEEINSNIVLKSKLMIDKKFYEQAKQIYLERCQLMSSKFAKNHNFRDIYSKQESTVNDHVWARRYFAFNQKSGVAYPF